MPKAGATWEGPQGTYKDDSRRNKAPTDLEEERRREAQHHLDVLEVVPVPWRDSDEAEGVGDTVSSSGEQRGPGRDRDTRVRGRAALTIDVHDGHTHDAGDDDQGEAGCVVVHQQQPVDARLWARGWVRQGATDPAARPLSVAWQVQPHLTPTSPFLPGW